MDLSLFYFSADSAAEDGASGYRLLLDGAQFADRNGFTAVWTPERHFHRFGGLYPNPALTCAALATLTERVALRAGSVVAPLHHPLRIAEDWAVVDRLSGGRAGLSLASGANPADFVLADTEYEQRREVTLDTVDAVRELWGGKPWHDPVQQADLTALPDPVQRRLPLWLSCGGSERTFVEAGRAGVGVLTHLMGQRQGDLRDHLAAYRAAFVPHDPGARPHVVLMVHTFVADTDEMARSTATAPLEQYLLTAMSMFSGRSRVDDDRSRFAVRSALTRFAGGDGLIGSVRTCEQRVRGFADLGVDEIGCLVDFGVPADEVMLSLPRLARLIADPPSP